MCRDIDINLKEQRLSSSSETLPSPCIGPKRIMLFIILKHKIHLENVCLYHKKKKVPTDILTETDRNSKFATPKVPEMP